jgi:glutamate-1-semialdehyde 2,1-aminomutase
MKLSKSLEIFEIGKILTPLSSQTYSKSYRYHVFGHAPIFLSHGKGSKVWDVDGNKFIDFVCALGPISIGYNNPRINRAITNQMKKGILFSLPHPVSIKLAQKLTEIIPGIEMVRFLKNGADATFAAVKLARAYTNKDLILMSGYHGMHDWSIITSENAKGVPSLLKDYTKSFKYNDLDDLNRLIETHNGKIAAIILEPIQGNGPSESYLSDIREICDNRGILLIFDEVVSGFRYALGGAAELYKIKPDLIAFGKGIANGMPLSVVGGRKDILSLIEKEKVFVSTTFGGETLSMVAALETIKQLSIRGTYEKIWEYGDLILDSLNKLIVDLNLGNYIEMTGLAPHCGPIFKSYRSIDKYDLASIYSKEMIQNGILTVGIINLSISHTTKDISQYIFASQKAFMKIQGFVEGDYSIEYDTRINPVFKR